MKLQRRAPSSISVKSFSANGTDALTEVKVINLWDGGMGIEGGENLKPNNVVRISLRARSDAPPFVMDSQVRGTQVVAGKVKTTLQFLTVETPKAYESYLIQIFYDSFAA